MSDTSIATTTTVTNSTVQRENYLTASLADSRAYKPTVKELMDATGLEFSEAGSMIGVGVAGHADYRDWQKIMSSSDPAGALSAANGQLFSGSVEWDPYGSDASTLDPTRVIAQSGRYALYRLDNISGENGYVTLQMLDGNDRRLTQAGVTGDQILRNAKIYGADVSDLVQLVNILDVSSLGLQNAMRQAVDSATTDAQPGLASEVGSETELSHELADWSQHSVTDLLVEERPESAPIVSGSGDELDNETNSLFSFSSEVDSSDFDGVNQELQSSSPVSKQAGHDLLSAFFDNLEINWDDYEILLDGEVIHDGKPSVTEGQSAFSEAETGIVDYTPNVNVPFDAEHTVNYDFAH